MTPLSQSYFNTKTLIEPAAYISAAVLAGSTRLIQYFPNTSMGGLILAASLGGLSSTLYNHHLDQPEHAYIDKLAHKVGLLACSLVGANIISYSLRGKVSLSPKGSLAFGTIQAGLTALALKYEESQSSTPSQPSTPTKPLRRSNQSQRNLTIEQEYDQYCVNQKAWRQLDTNTRSQLAARFYQQGFYGLHLFEAPINLQIVDPTLADYFANPDKTPSGKDAFDHYATQLEPSKLSWLREILQGMEMWSQLDPDQLFPILDCFAQHDIEMLSFNFDDQHFAYIQEHPVYLDLLYNTSQKDLLFGASFAFIWSQFNDVRLLPTIGEAISRLSISEIQRMGPQHLRMCHFLFSIDLEEHQGQSNHWNTLDPTLQSAFFKRWLAYETLVDCEPKLIVDTLDISWLNTLSDEELYNFSWNQREWLTALQNYPATQNQLKPSTIHAVNRNKTTLQVLHRMSHDLAEKVRTPSGGRPSIKLSQSFKGDLAWQLERIVKDKRDADITGYNDLTIQDQDALNTLIRQNSLQYSTQGA